MSEQAKPEGRAKTVAELIATGDWSDNNLCLRKIAQLANGKKLMEAAKDLSPEQAFELATKSTIEGTAHIIKPDEQPGTVRGLGSLYCSVAGCHFSTLRMTVELPGEVGATDYFPSLDSLDKGQFPCKLDAQSDLEPK